MTTTLIRRLSQAISGPEPSDLPEIPESYSTQYQTRRASILMVKTRRGNINYERFLCSPAEDNDAPERSVTWPEEFGTEVLGQVSQRWNQSFQFWIPRPPAPEQYGMEVAENVAPLHTLVIALPLPPLSGDEASFVHIDGTMLMTWLTDTARRFTEKVTWSIIYELAEPCFQLGDGTHALAVRKQLARFALLSQQRRTGGQADSSAHRPPDVECQDGEHRIVRH